jgi:hypothetical protein
VAPAAVWAVDAASRLVPGPACLSRALAAQALLERRGHRAELRIGFRREPDGRLAGHAWVETAGADVGLARPSGERAMGGGPAGAAG